MNKERKQMTEMIVEVLVALPAGKRMPRISRALGKCVNGLLSSEERALRAMEPYKDSASTKANYAQAQASVKGLHVAAEALAEHDYDTAIEELEGLLR